MAIVGKKWYSKERETNMDSVFGDGNGNVESCHYDNSSTSINMAGYFIKKFTPGERHPVVVLVTKWPKRVLRGCYGNR